MSGGEWAAIRRSGGVHLNCEEEEEEATSTAHVHSSQRQGYAGGGSGRGGGKVAAQASGAAQEAGSRRASTQPQGHGSSSSHMHTGAPLAPLSTTSTGSGVVPFSTLPPAALTELHGFNAAMLSGYGLSSPSVLAAMGDNPDALGRYLSHYLRAINALSYVKATLQEMGQSVGVVTLPTAATPAGATVAPAVAAGVDHDPTPNAGDPPTHAGGAGGQ